MPVLDDTELIQLIESAFDGVTLGDGVSLNMCEYDDSGGCDSHYAELAKSDERDDWRKIPDSVLASHSVTFCFTDLLGYRFYLPAYMRSAIRSSRSCVSETVTFALNPRAYQFEETAFGDWFTAEQLAAMIAFLEWWIQGYGDARDRQNLQAIRDLVDSASETPPHD